MFITINNHGFNESSSKRNICVAGVGAIGRNVVHSQKISAEDVSRVDFLTMFDYDTSDVSEEKDLACKKACNDSFCLFVIADIEDYNALDSACVLSDYYHINEGNRKLCFCITLEKYKGTSYDEQLHTCFDKVIYVKKRSLFFTPIEALFVHSTGCVGIDYADVYHIIRGRDLYLLQVEDTEINTIKDKIASAIEEKAEAMNNVNVFFSISFNATMSIDDFEEIRSIVTDTVSNYDCNAESLYNFTFNSEADGIAKVSILLCDVGELSNKKTNKEKNK